MILHRVMHSIQVGYGVFHIVHRAIFVLVMNCVTAVSVVLDMGMLEPVSCVFLFLHVCHVLLRAFGERFPPMTPCLDLNRTLDALTCLWRAISRRYEILTITATLARVSRRKFVPHLVVRELFTLRLLRHVSSPYAPLSMMREHVLANASPTWTRTRAIAYATSP